ncbi:MAG TPA: c-type cytochrome [Actinomycetota bacterium]|nr:c-type cytochrome [Actinomycetota bacterium]
MIVLGISAGQAILIGVASGVAVLLVAGAAVNAMRRPRRAAGPDIPPGMRPGPSDADLEKPVLEKLLAWGLLMVVVMALWVPGVFLHENVANKEDTQTLLEESINRGHLTTLPGSEANQLGFNCERCHGTNLHGGQNLFNGNIVAVPNLQTVCGGTAFGHAQIHSLDDVIDTIAQGRTGTDMPSWSVRFAGAMDDQQINDLVNYILSIQKVPDAKNVCLNPEKPA